MDFLSLSLRMADSRMYRPYAFYDGDLWTPQERAHIADRMQKTHPEEVDAMYNNWCFSRYHGARYTVKRASWDMSVWWSDNLDHLLDAVDLAGARWTKPLLDEIFPDARIITDAEVPTQWQHRTVNAATTIWIIERPHITALLVAYGDSIFEQQIEMHHPEKE